MHRSSTTGIARFHALRDGNANTISTSADPKGTEPRMFRVRQESPRS